MEEEDELEVTIVAGVTDDPVVRAVERLFHREYERMVRLAFTLLRLDAAAEDAVQDRGSCSALQALRRVAAMCRVLVVPNRHVGATS